MIRIGITGGIGMGKSSASEFLARDGIPVADSDGIARELVAPGQAALGEIVAAFGGGMLRADGTLDRSRLGELVFRDSGARSCLESILHPRIRAQWQGRLAAWGASGARAGAVVIPLLYETSVEERFDTVVCVACSGATQRERLHRRGWSDGEVDRRNAAQWAVGEKMRRARFVIWTEPPLVEVGEQWRLIRGTLGI